MTQKKKSKKDQGLAVCGKIIKLCVEKIPLVFNQHNGLSSPKSNSNQRKNIK